MDAAVTGLVGVLVGSAITGSWQFALAYRKDRRERRAAARLIAAELKRIYGLLLAPTASDLALTLINQLPEQTPAWQDHQGALAADLASGDWATVARAYVNLPALLALRIIDFEQADRDLRNTVRRIVSDTASFIRDALAVLERQEESATRYRPLDLSEIASASTSGPAR